MNMSDSSDRFRESAATTRSNEGSCKFPVICTANIPAEVCHLRLLSILILLLLYLRTIILNSARQILDRYSKDTAEDLEGVHATLMTTTNVKAISTPSKQPMQSFDSPFLDWTPEKIYEFFLSSIQPLCGSLYSGLWPAHTFIILDERTV